MEAQEILNKTFSKQANAGVSPDDARLGDYRLIARNYARMERAIAVLSDLQSHRSYIYYGRFAQVLGLGTCGEEEVSTIWEEDIFRRIHPDDLAEKHLQELYFFEYVRRQPRHKRGDYYLTSQLRIRNGEGHYLRTEHRMYYIPGMGNGAPWLALCLYRPLVFDLRARGLIVDSTTGQLKTLGQRDDIGLLTERELQVLRFIEGGMRNKEIAQLLCISVHTVSRHRQGILSKLQVKSSIEACRLAKELKLI